MDQEAVLSDAATRLKTKEGNERTTPSGARFLPRFLRNMGHASFARRFNAWLNRPISWPPFLAEGGRSRQPARPVKATQAPDAPLAPSAAPVVPVRDFVIEQKLWGGGFLGPCSKEHTLDLAQPLALTPASNFLLVGAGAGGAARAVTEKFGCWVDAVEVDKRVGGLAAVAVKKYSLDKVKIRAVDPAAPGLQDNRYDSVLAMEAFWPIREKNELLVAAAQALKSGGSFHMTEYVMAADGGGAAGGGWVDADGTPVALWGQSAIRQCLKDNGLRVRIEEDATEDLVHDALAAWQQFSNSIAPSSLTPEQTAFLFKLGNQWDARIDALQKGKVKLQRVFAIKT